MLLPFLLAAGGQTAISGDRTGLLQSSTLVPTGCTQLETGMRYGKERGGGDAASIPSALRYGLCADLELRASNSLWNWAQREGAADDSGLGPLSLGLKGPLDLSWVGIDLGWADSTAWIADLRMPGGSLEGSPDSFSPSVSGVASWTPQNSLWQLSTQLGLAYDPDHLSLAVSMAASASHPVMDASNVYLEAGWFPRSILEPDPLFVGGGLITRLSTDLQVDLGFDYGLGETSGDWIVGLGLCWRW